MADSALDEMRYQAAAASNQTSNLIIKSTILRLIRTNNLRGRFLDYGAGRGELVRYIQEEGCASKIDAVDIFGRPEDLPDTINWHTQDLNDRFDSDEQFDVITCSEVIEHLENPRAVFRNIHKLLTPGGALILTMPNQECLKSLIGLVFKRHFSFFLVPWYPAHITALVAMDLERICSETGFTKPQAVYTNEGTIPKLSWITWQRISLRLLRGRWFSDNVAILARKLPVPAAS